MSEGVCHRQYILPFIALDLGITVPTVRGAEGVGQAENAAHLLSVREEGMGTLGLCVMEACCSVFCSPETVRPV